VQRGLRLNVVAGRLSREQLLEAQINPSARIAPGYGILNLAFENGQALNRVLKEERSKYLADEGGE
jgi:quinoprotein glucose dehydrogenase